MAPSDLSPSSSLWEIEGQQVQAPDRALRAVLGWQHNPICHLQERELRVAFVDFCHELYLHALQLPVDLANAVEDVVGLGWATPAIEPPPDPAGFALGASPEQSAGWGGKDAGTAGSEQPASFQVAVAAPTFGKADWDVQHHGQGLKPADCGEEFCRAGKVGESGLATFGLGHHQPAAVLGPVGSDQCWLR